VSRRKKEAPPPRPSPKERGNVETEKGRNDEGRMTNDKENVGKIFFYTHTRLLIVRYSANVILRGF